MTAKEYFVKYSGPIVHEIEEKKTDCLLKFAQEMVQETITIIAGKTSKEDSCVLGVCRQQCQKFDRIAEMFEETYGHPILKKGSFPIILCRQIPELEGRL